MAEPIASVVDTIAVDNNTSEVQVQYPIIITYTCNDEIATDKYGNIYSVVPYSFSVWVCDTNSELVCGWLKVMIYEWLMCSQKLEFKHWSVPWPNPSTEYTKCVKYFIEHPYEMAFRVDCIKSECFTTKQVLENSVVEYDDDFDEYTYIYEGDVYVNGKKTVFKVKMSLCALSNSEANQKTIFDEIEFCGFEDDIDGFSPDNMCVRAIIHGDDMHRDTIWKLGL